MPIIVNPLHPVFAAEIVGADLTRAPDDELVRTVENAMDQYGVCVVRDAKISDEEHIRFSRAFGPLLLAPGAGRGKRRLRSELYDASNLDENNEIIPYDSERRRLAKGAERFHSDSSFTSRPTKWSLLLGHIVPPEGGETHFADARAGYDALPFETRARIAELVGIHDFFRGRERTGLQGVTDATRATIPSVTHPLVRTMPYGRRALFIGGHATGIVGWPESQAQALLDELYAFITEERFVYRHKWHPWDLVIWDNRSVLHRATPLTTDRYKRDVRRTTICEYGSERPYRARVA